MQNAPRPSVSAVLEAHARSQRASWGDAPVRRPAETRTFDQPARPSAPLG